MEVWHRSFRLPHDRSVDLEKVCLDIMRPTLEMGPTTFSMCTVARKVERAPPDFTGRQGYLVEGTFHREELEMATHPVGVGPGQNSMLV